MAIKDSWRMYLTLSRPHSTSAKALRIYSISYDPLSSMNCRDNNLNVRSGGHQTTLIGGEWQFTHATRIEQDDQT